MPSARHWVGHSLAPRPKPSVPTCRLCDPSPFYRYLGPGYTLFSYGGISGRYSSAYCGSSSTAVAVWWFDHYENRHRGLQAQTIALPFFSKTRNAPVPIATRLPSASLTFASAVAVRRVRCTTSLSQVMRPSLTAPRKCTFISTVAVLTPTSASTERPMALSMSEAYTPPCSVPVPLRWVSSTSMYMTDLPGSTSSTFAPICLEKVTSSLKYLARWSSCSSLRAPILSLTERSLLRILSSRGPPAP